MALFLMNDKLVCYFQKYYYTDHFPNGHLMQNFNLGPISNGSQTSFLEKKKKPFKLILQDSKTFFNPF